MRSARLWFVFVCLSILLGCSDGQNLGSVTGKVTFEGNPLPNAKIVFRPEDGRVSTAKTDANGEYRLMYTKDQFGAEIGAHTVIITTGELETTAKGERVIPEKLPHKYNKRSELKEEVKAGGNVIDFKLTK